MSEFQYGMIAGAILLLAAEAVWHFILRGILRQ